MAVDSVPTWDMLSLAMFSKWVAHARQPKKLWTYDLIACSTSWGSGEKNAQEEEVNNKINHTCYALQSDVYY